MLATSKITTFKQKQAEIFIEICTSNDSVIYLKYHSILPLRHHLSLSMFSWTILRDKNTFLILQFFVPLRRYCFLSLESFSHFIIPFVFRSIDRWHSFVYKLVTIKLLHSCHIWELLRITNGVLCPFVYFMRDKIFNHDKNQNQCKQWQRQRHCLLCFMKSKTH